jgi:putative component of toxin-antitoxin plasmid stabilization module
MALERVAANIADDLTDISLHDEIKSRAYELYERWSDDVERADAKKELQSELPRVAYAAAQIQKYSNGELGDNKTVRAARVYLRALTSFIYQA